MEPRLTPEHLDLVADKALFLVALRRAVGARQRRLALVRHRAAARRLDAALATTPSALTGLGRTLALTPVEATLVEVLVAAALHPGVADALAALGPTDGDGSSAPLGTRLLLTLVPESAAERLALARVLLGGGALFRHGLVARRDDEDLAEPTFTATPRLLALLLGESDPGAPLLGIAARLRGGLGLLDLVAPPSVLAALEGLVRGHARARATLRTASLPASAAGRAALVVAVAAPPGGGRTTLAHALAGALPGGLLHVEGRALAGATDRARAAAFEELRFEGFLRDTPVYLDDADALIDAEPPARHALLRYLDTAHGLVFVALRDDTPLTLLRTRVHHVVRWDAPSVADRTLLWEKHLPPELALAPDVDPASLASRFPLAGALVRSAVTSALVEQAGARRPAPLTDAVLARAALAQLAPDLGALVRTSEARPALEGVILPPAEAARLREIVAAASVHARVMDTWGFRDKLATGAGLTVLFDGPPGTGKTLCAEALAGALGLPLLRVNVPGIVSKFVGETEQRLQEVFDRARATHAVLLFDEADALFAQRVAVRSATDRYANMEVNVLLQELERYAGVAVLTTNHFGNLDPALVRRILYRLTFPFPEAEERERIWGALLPDRTPRAADLDLPLLARSLEFSGGEIKNTVLRAAHIAAHRNDALRHDDILTAARDECRATGKLFTLQPSRRESHERVEGTAIARHPRAA